MKTSALSTRVSLLVLSCLLGCRPTPKLPERLELSAATFSLQFGEARTVTARALVGTRDTSLDGLTWTSSDSAVVAVTAGDPGTANVQGLSAGTATVTAQVRDAVATLEVTVAARVITLERVDVTPTSPSLAKGLRLQLHATGVYNDGSTRDLTASAAWASADGTRATVSSGGLVTAVSVGDVELRALKDGLVGRVTLHVTAASVVGVDARPALLSLARGTSQQFTATARLSDATSQDVTGQVLWASSDAVTASIDAAGKLTANQVGTVTVSATLVDVVGSAIVTVTAAVLRGLAVSPAAVSLPLGSQVQLAVTGTFSDGTQQDVTPQASWVSGTPAVAVVSPSGLVTSMAQGLTVVTATVSGISAAASITGVAAQLQTIHVAPQGLLLAKGLSRAFTATGLYTDTTTRDLTATLTWNSSDAGVATVSNAAADVGLVAALLEGTTEVSATDGTLTGTSTLTVTSAMLLAVDVAPLTATVASGLTQQLTATGTYSDGTHGDVTAQMGWSTSDAGVATVSNAAGSEGLATAVAQGTAALSATAGLVTASMTLTVGPPVLQRIDVTGLSASLAKGRSEALTAMGVYSDGSLQDLTGTVTWAPAAGAVLQVSSAGVLTANGVGTAAVTATLGLKVGTASFDVTAAELDLVYVSPAAPSVPLGLTQAMVAHGQYSDGTTPVLSAGVTWGSADQSAATVDAAGLLTTVAQGSSLVTATWGGKSGGTLVTVAAPALVSITVTPANPSLDKTQTLQMVAMGHYTDNTDVVVTGAVTWESSAPLVASISLAGEVTAILPGTTTLKASQGTVHGSTQLTVNRPPLLSLGVTPASATINPFATQAFSALATYTDSSTEDVTALVTWSSSDTAVASIAPTGLALGRTSGTVTITAQWGLAAPTAQLTVNSATLQSLAVTGKSRFATGTGAQLTATATWSDTTTSDVTAFATWSSDTPARAQFTDADGVRGVVLGVAAGGASLTAALGGVTSPGFAVQVVDANAPLSARCATGLVISQLYGGGGNTGAPAATLRNDFVELHNAGTSPVGLGGLSLQYAGATGASWASVPLASVTVPAGGYYLVQLASGGSAGALLPSSDQASTTINMSAAAGKLALVSGTTALTVACPTAGVLDFVGFGATANCSEGAAAPAQSNITSLTRAAGGCRDGNQNSADLTVGGTITPRSSASPPQLCGCFVNGTTAAEQLSACLLESPASQTVGAGQVSAAVPALVTQPGSTDTAGFDPALQVQVGFGPVGVDPTAAAGWQWWPAVARTPGPVSDGYQGVFVAPTSGSYGFTARASRDGVNWTVCDLNGAGSGAGLAFELGQLGALAVP